VSKAVLGLTPNTTYYLRVRAETSSVQGGGAGAYTSPAVPVLMPRSYQLTPSISNGGSIAPRTAVQVTAGTDYTFTAYPNVGYAINTWWLDGVDQHVATSTFKLTNIQAAHTIKATFKVMLPVTMTITKTGAGTGTVTPFGTMNVPYGGNLFLTATPAKYNQVTTWTLLPDNTVLQTGGTTLQYSNVTTAKTIQVDFEPYPAPVVNSVNGLTTLNNLNTGKLVVSNLAGANFLTGARVVLQMAGQPDISATDVQVVNATKITCVFNFTTNQAGDWSLVVINPDNQVGILPGKLTLVEDQPHVSAILPISGVRGTTVAVYDIQGYGFKQGATASLTLGGTTIPFDAVTFIGESKLTGSITLPADATPGDWTLTVTNPDSHKNPSTDNVTFHIFATPPPTVSTYSPMLGYDTDITVLLTLDGSNFDTVAPSVVLKKAGQTDITGTLQSAMDTELVFSFDLLGKPDGLWDIVVTNSDSQYCVLPQAFSIVPTDLTGVTVSTDLDWPQPNGTTVTITATPQGTTSDVQYNFFSKYYDQTIRQWIVLPLSNGYVNTNTYTWTPEFPENYWLYAKARKAGSTADYQVISPDVYFQVLEPTLTSVTLTLSPSAAGAVNDPVFLTAGCTGTVNPANVEYRFIGYKYNPATSDWDFFDIRGYNTTPYCTWQPTEAGEYDIYVLGRIEGSTATFQQAAMASFTVN